MLNSLLDCWKSLTAIGTVSLPVVGLFFLSTKSVNWSNPLGYYTKLKLFIKKNRSTSQASVATYETSGGTNNRYQITQASSNTDQQSNNSPDLIAEYPITSLDKESWWKYCLPNSSQLKQNGNTQTTSVASEGEECKLEYRNKGSEVIDHLLKLGLKFLKLQHQINLFLFYHSNKNSTSLVNDLTNGSDWRAQLLTKCSLREKSNGDSILKDFFVSTSPVSQNCLLVPSQVELTLTLGGSEEQVKSDSSDSSGIKLDEIKKGTISGNIGYSFSDYYGKLQDFSWKNGQPSSGGNGQDTKSPVLISLKPAGGKKFEFKLESTGESQAATLNFDDLYGKYEKRDLQLCDFLKALNSSSGGGSQLCRQNSK